MKNRRSEKLNGDGQEVDPGQEYRILVYDRKMDEYCFILLRDRREGFVTDFFVGGKIKIMRYMPETAYVFGEEAEYPTFQADQLEEAQKWAKARCIEHREIPDWWLVEDDSQMNSLAQEIISEPKVKITKIPPRSKRPEYDPEDEDWDYCADYDCRYRRKSSQELNYHI
jgi:hypothetical protein